MSERLDYRCAEHGICNEFVIVTLLVLLVTGQLKYNLLSLLVTKFQKWHFVTAANFFTKVSCYYSCLQREFCGRTESDIQAGPKKARPQTHDHHSVKS